MDRFGDVTCLGGAQGAPLLGWWVISSDFGPEFLSISTATLGNKSSGKSRNWIRPLARSVSTSGSETMNDSYIQNLRYKLQRRVRRLKGIEEPEWFHNQLCQFRIWMENEPLLGGILDRLKLEPESRDFYERDYIHTYRLGEFPKFGNDDAQASLCYGMINFFTHEEELDNAGEAEFLRARTYAEGLTAFCEVFLEPLYDYLDEHLDDTGVILALLRRYKKRCEWFHRKHLLEKFEADTQNGEKNLAQDAYEYLFDQGLELYIEPESPAGRPDMVSAEIGAERLIADAKIFNGTKSYLTKGFRQIYDYAAEHNSPVGFLLIFKTCERDLHLSLTGEVSGVPYMIHNNRTFFFVVVDLFAYQQSASKRGQLTAVELTADELVSAVDDLAGEISAAGEEPESE
ncbi:MAG: hypothetical protein SVX28_12060 [Pseudomonadota bacterium]|nr:hypothetical protein [Pseudomonadota bacterium]